jgi:diguanylate cyclase
MNVSAPLSAEPPERDERSRSSDRDPRYTMQVARTALERIAALNLPADPHSFAVWYAYSSSQDPRLNHEINSLLSGKPKLSIADVDRICEEYLSPLGSLARIEKVGSDLGQEVDQIVDLIEAATGSAATYQENLAEAHHKLGAPASRETLRAIVQSLVQSTKAMEQRNGSLETALRISRQVIENMQREVDEIRSESLRDPLTSLANRKHFEMILEQAIGETDTGEDPCSVLLMDIDHFKQFNDGHGHQVGDEVLRLMARHLRESLKGLDVAARYGGEEFAVLLPKTDLARAKMVAENIRAAIAKKVVRKRSTGESLGQVTVSIGVAEHQRGEDSESLIGRADAALYQAKRAGRNVVCG